MMVMDSHHDSVRCPSGAKAIKRTTDTSRPGANPGPSFPKQFNVLLQDDHLGYLVIKVAID